MNEELMTPLPIIIFRQLSPFSEPYLDTIKYSAKGILMKIQFLNGGLANQAFQYIFTRFAELRHPDEEPWYLDDSVFFTNPVHNGYELTKIFGIHPNLLSEYFDPDVWEYMMEVKKADGKSVPQMLMENGVELRMIAETSNHTEWNPFHGPIAQLQQANIFQPDVTDVVGDFYFHGYWINRKYFDAYRAEMLQDFTFPEFTETHNLEFAEKIRTSNAVAVHVRRGDFVKLGWNTPTELIHQAIEVLRDHVPDMTLFVFSDDLAWCRENTFTLGLNLGKEAVFVDGNHGASSFRDLQLMSLCPHMVLGASSFNYLAAILRRNPGFIVNLTSREI